MKSLSDKVFVITGAGSGIGRALARRLDAEGAQLALADWDQAGLSDTAARLSGGDLFTRRLDVSDREDVHRFSEEVVAHFGHVDAVINNAGVAHSQTVADVSYEDFDWIVGINFWGVVHGTKAFLPHLLQRPEAAIINISSVFGIIAVPTQSTYNATKFAVRGFTEALRHEMAGGPVHVMCVHPGGIRTNIVRSARYYVDPDGERDPAAAVRKFDTLARTSPEQAAATILKALSRGRARCLIGLDAVLIDRIQRWMPVRYWGLIGWAMKALSRR